MQEKRKTHTSTEVKKRWNKAHYKEVKAQIDKELVEEWEAKIKENEIGKAEFIRNAIKEYLNK